MDRRQRGKRPESTRDFHDKSSHYKHDISTQSERLSKSSESKSHHGDESNGDSTKSDRGRDDRYERSKVRLKEKPQSRDTKRMDREYNSGDRRDSSSRGGRDDRKHKDDDGGRSRRNDDYNRSRTEERDRDRDRDTREYRKGSGATGMPRKYGGGYQGMITS